jgi:hypothetical protein
MEGWDGAVAAEGGQGSMGAMISIPDSRVNEIGSAGPENLSRRTKRPKAAN